MRNKNSLRTVIVLFCLSVLFGISCSNKGYNNKSLLTGNEISKVLFLATGENNPRNSEGDFITLKNGRILFVYTHYTGDSYMDHAPAYIASRYSDDKGKTWSSQDELVVTQEGKQNVMSVSLLRLKNGEIALFYLRKDSDESCMPLVRFSGDEGKTWSAPLNCIAERTSYFNMHNNRVIQLNDGRLLFPVATSNISSAYYSDDNGRSWKPGKNVPKMDSAFNEEPAVVELKNGDIYMIMRTDTSTQYCAYSKDKGITFSTATASNIISASQSPASITRIPSTGHLLLVWNNNNNTTTKRSKAARTPLNTAISKDDGKTWENIRIVEGNPKGSFCYTAIHFTEQQVLLGYFDWSTRAITITRLDIGWLYHTPTEK